MGKELSRGEVQTFKSDTDVALHEVQVKVMDGQTALRQAQSDLRELRAEATELLVTKASLEAQLKIAQARIAQLEQSETGEFLSQFSDTIEQLGKLTAPWSKNTGPVFVPPGTETKS